MTPLVHLERRDGVATITLDSPSNRNALSQQLMAELGQQLEAAIGDSEVRVIVLTGTGSVFCAGADLKEQRNANELGDGKTGAGPLGDILSTMWHSPKPVVGRINGAARGGGIGLVAACDIAVVSESSVFAFSEVRLGVIPATISVVVIPKLGEAKALELFLTGEPFSGRDAVSFGLVNRCVAGDELDATVGRYVESLMKGPASALEGCKQLIRDVPQMPIAQAFAEMKDRSAAYFASPDALEGMRAFAEKRAPSWATRE